MKIKSLIIFAIVCLAFAGCNSNDLNNGSGDSTMMDSTMTDSINNNDTGAVNNSELMVDSTRREAPVH